MRQGTLCANLKQTQECRRHSMARWWDTEMASAGQALASDPSMGFDVATTPDQVFNGQVPGQLKYEAKYTQGQYEDDKEDVQQKRSGFLGAMLNFTDKADDVANSVTGGMWDKVQDNILAPVGKAVWYPVDKLATGAHWLYSNVVSRPLSMILQMDAQAALDA